MPTTPRYVHRILVPVVFPGGVAPGAGKSGGNQLTVAINGKGNPVLRGSALAGALRHAWSERKLSSQDAPQVEEEMWRWFGRPLGKKTKKSEDNANQNSQDRKGKDDSFSSDLPSPLKVADTEIDIGAAAREIRVHNCVDRHTGAVRGQGLFSLETLPPGCKGKIILKLELPEDEDDAEAATFIAELLAVIGGGLTLGGNSARGVGAVKLDGQPLYRHFDLGGIDGLADWLDESWRWRNGEDLDGIKPPALDKEMAAESLRVTLDLMVPRGQDICVGSGEGAEYAIEPRRVVDCAGKERWCIPGSSLRGHFRSWFTRLAARDSGSAQCPPPADICKVSLEKSNATGEQIGWLLHSKAEAEANKRKLRKAPAKIDEVAPCPVDRLFGSLYAAGRIHISDAIGAVTSSPHVQHRRHVAVDRVTGGAGEGFLFDHGALLAGQRFQFSIVMRQPTEVEVKWLAATIKALDMGIIRVGSSKSSGRLALAASPSATGPHKEIVANIKPSEVC